MRHRPQGGQSSLTKNGMKRSVVRRVSRRFHDYYDALDRAIAEAREAHDIKCKAGCSACCKQAVTLSVPEALAILEPLLYEPVRRMWYLRSTYQRITRQAKMCLDDQVNVQTWFEKEIPCVFLKEDRCSIYEDRPAACRVHMVVSDPAQCQPPRLQPIVKVDIHNWFEAAEYEAYQTERETGLTAQIAPMPVALAWATTAILEGPDVLRRKLGAHKVFSNDELAALWWAVRFTSQEQWEREKQRRTITPDELANVDRLARYMEYVEGGRQDSNHVGG